jgi:hypothetical protein
MPAVPLKADTLLERSEPPLRATFGLMHRSNGACQLLALIVN